MKLKTMNTEIEKVKSMLKSGITLREALDQLNISYSTWRKICKQEKIKIAIPRGKRATVYTHERVKEVKKRINKGEFLVDVASEMGMDSKNLSRFCRNNGIKLFTESTLKDNYARRNYSKAGRPKGQSEKTLKIKQRIISGFKDTEIANEIGVTRQYVNHIRKKMDNENTD